MRQLTIQNFICYLIYFGGRKAFRKIIQHKEIWMTSSIKISFWLIIIMCETKYLGYIRQNHFQYKIIQKAFHP